MAFSYLGCDKTIRAPDDGPLALRLPLFLFIRIVVVRAGVSVIGAIIVFILAPTEKRLAVIVVVLVVRVVVGILVGFGGAALSRPASLHFSGPELRAAAADRCSRG
jgi:hypothetical protein